MGSSSSRVPTGVFVGLSTLDVIQSVQRLPASNEKIVAQAVAVAAGGPATNAAVAFAALGGRSILVTRLSQDGVGQLAADDLAACGVEVRQADASDGLRTTVASIMVTAATGERAVVSAVDQGRSVGGVESGFGRGLVARLRPDVVLVDSYELDLSLPIAREAKDAGVPVLLDCGVKKARSDEQLRYVDAAIVSEEYLPGGAGAIAEDIGRQGVRFGAITAGAAPIRFWVGDWTTLSDRPVAAVPVVDTLGAGDFFHGALAFDVARNGLSESGFGDGLGFAARVAALSIREFGSRSWLRHLGQFQG